MRTIRCDFCNRIIDEGNESFYAIDEIMFTNPRSTNYTLITKDSKDRKEYRQEESWVSYDDIDICHTCWWTDKLKALREIIQKRIGNGD